MLSDTFLKVLGKKMSSDEDSPNLKRQKFQNERTLNNEDSPSASYDIEESFGPALPPHLLEKMKQQNEKDETIGKTANTIQETQECDRDKVKRKVIGPEIPAHLMPKVSVEDEPLIEEETEPDDVYGPSLSLMTGGDGEVGDYHEHFSRSRKVEESPGVSAQRETWMLELPPERAAQFGLGPRQFRKKPANERDLDRSGWTETPMSKGKEPNRSKDGEKLIRQREIDERNKAMDELTKKLQKKKKREESLLEIHQKKMRKKAKKEAKKREKEGKKVERRPFDRNIDLQVNRFDESQKRAVLKKAQLLNDRFSSGESKYL